MIEQVRGVLEAHPEIELAYLFGSRATGRSRPDSDFDIALQSASPLSASQHVALIAELAGATGSPIDLVDLRTAGEPLLGEILAHGRRLVGSNEAHATLVTRHLLDEADFMPYVRRLLADRRAAWLKT